MPISAPRQNPEAGPYWTSPDGVSARLYLGDAIVALKKIPSRTVHCAVTSPPYWSLRDYGTGTWEGGSAGCEHIAGSMRGDTEGKKGARLDNPGSPAPKYYRHTCDKCGARRTDDSQIGLEDVHDCLGWAKGSPCGACYVCHIVEVFAELRRVLRDDGTLWLNLGDSYACAGRTGHGGDSNLTGIPWRVALALQADGWVLRQDIIWYSPNKLPEPVTNRCIRSHEHVFLLSKGSDYYFDAVAIQVPCKVPYRSSDFLPNSPKDSLGVKTAATQASRSNRSNELRADDVNKRDVWIVSTRGYPGAHFATFSPALITPCILAGTSECGACAACGRPYERIVARTGGVAADNDSRTKSRDRSFKWSRNGKPGTGSTLDGTIAARKTVGWRKMCGCRTGEVVPCTVLDPFVGSGTTVATAVELGRRGVGIDLSEKYLREHAIPRVEAALRGEAPPRRRAVVVPEDTPPAPGRLR